MLKRKCEHEGDVAFAIDLLMNKTAGIEIADKLSIKHIRSSIENLSEVTRVGDGHKVIDFNEKHAQALIGIALKVKTRKH
jgi:hypothetical protein